MSDLSGNKTILDQLGGNRFIAMTGAKGFVGSAAPVSLSFRIDGGAQKRINAVRVVLDASDTYTMTFLSIRKYEPKEVAVHSGLHFDQLQSTFKAETGFATHL